MSRRIRDPDWPRLMSIEVACAYLGGISREAFWAAVVPHLSAQKLPDGIIRYDRHHIDAWVDGRGDIGPRRSDADWLKELGDA
jgi:hypothetical protein